MSFLKILFTLLLLVAAFSLSAQDVIRGNVSTVSTPNTQAAPLPGVNIYWSGTAVGTSSLPDGSFSLQLPDALPADLVFSFVGFQSDTIRVSGSGQLLSVALRKSIVLDEAEITGRREAVHLSTTETINTASLGREHLQKAACCNLSESFETDASIDVVEEDAVAGTRKILMLGLDGVYSQILFENLPFIRGLASTYGLSYVPGTWVQSIQVSKGAGSVVNGFESMSGQINLELWKPDAEEKAFFNVYGNHMGRLEANGYLRSKVNDKWSTLVMGHGRTSVLRVDNNGDSFQDMPLDNEIQFFNRWKYVGDKRMHQFGVRLLADDKLGGQIQFDPGQDRSDQPYYGIGVRTRFASAFGKTGFLFPSTPWKSIGLLARTSYHEQDTYFGLRDYDATHTSGYFNGIYMSKIATTDHTFKTGVSFQIDDYQQQFNDSAFDRTELIPGAFFEYSWTREDKFSLLAGVRADYHNIFGLFVTPRLHLKYNFSPLSVLRVSGGRGFRSPVLFAENLGKLASSRAIFVLETPQAEESWNTGISFLQKFTLAGMEGSFNADYFFTWFENQLIADMDYSADHLLFYNLRGSSFSHSFQADFTISPVARFDIKTAYKRYIVKTDYLSEGLLDRPFVPRDRALLNLAYHTRYEIWKFDATANLYGMSRIPSTETNPVAFQRATSSPTFVMLSAQVTKKFRFGEFYVGGENLLNYRQPNPIIDPQNPFGPNFDAAMVWGPINGTVVYAGFRTNF